MKNQKTILISSAIILVIGFIAATFFYNQSQKQKYSFLAQENADVFIREHSPRMGPEDAEIFLVEFLDPECESCRMFYPIVKKIMKDYPNKINLTIRYVPYHGNSKFVIAILEASRNQKLFWETLETVFRTQPQWGDHHNPKPEKLWGFLSEVKGLNIDQIKNDMQNPIIQELIKQDFEDAQTLGVRGTPTFFVNGKKPDQFGEGPLRQLIESELGK